MGSTKTERLRLLMEDEPLDATDEGATVVKTASTLIDSPCLPPTINDELNSEDLEPRILGHDGESPTSTKRGRRRNRRKRSAALSDSTAVSENHQPSPIDKSLDGRTVGELASLDMTFCPVAAVSKYPYKYMRASPTVSEVVSRNYFAAGIFWMRTWTIFYLHPPPSISEKALLFVPSSEVQALLDTINTDLKLQLKFPKYSTEPGFHLDFANVPRPRFLGTCTSKEVFDKMQKQMPGSEFKVEGEIPFVGLEDDRSFNAFKAKMEAAVQATKNKSKASKEKKKVERVYQKGRLCSQLKRTQRYLGLRPLGEAGSKTANPYSIPGLSLAKLQKAVEERAPASVFVLPELKATQSAPYSFDSSVVFICVDVESYERDHNLITEIGIATLDTKDLIDVSPGEGGIEWMNKIRARHLRIKERTHLVNKDFVNGCADRFEKSFGTSEFISIKEAPQVVASCFRSPFSAVKENSNINVEDKEDEKRNLILVGHNTKADIDYLRQLGYDPSNLSNLLEVLDTADLFRALKYENSGRGLGSLLLDLGLPGWNLHNAGNDATYTLQALIGISFKSLAAKRERQAAFSEKERQIRLDAAIQEAEERILDDEEEWNLADIEDDGGVAVNIIEKPNEGTGGAQADAGTRGGFGSGGRAGGGRGRGGVGRGGRGRGGQAPALAPWGNSRSRLEERLAKETAGERDKEERELAGLLVAPSDRV
ncbi:hypothetical protein MMC24_004267 [Lignoscripta atroalba]|nr:hypothetical protein [Lignoscripta atroalba]